MHKHMIQQDNDRLGGEFPEHIFTKRVKFDHFAVGNCWSKAFM
jgi:hypothetical protein